LIRAQHLSTSPGFAIIELPLVIFVFAILAAILVPNFFRARENGQLKACRTHLGNFAAALHYYAEDHHGLYPNKASELIPDYLTGLPTCPRNGDYLLRTTHNPDLYLVSCPGDHFVAKLDERRRPVRSNVRGPELKAPLKVE
jgi:type II secretory pathway pseudopilin PulG